MTEPKTYYIALVSVGPGFFTANYMVDHTVAEGDMITVRGASTGGLEMQGQILSVEIRVVDVATESDGVPWLDSPVGQTTDGRSTR